MFNHINMKVLYEMTEGDLDMMTEMIQVFLNQTPEIIERLERGLSENSTGLVKESAHKMKPTFSYVGNEDAVALCLELESIAGKSDDVNENIRTLAKKLTTMAEKIIADLELYRDSVG